MEKQFTDNWNKFNQCMSQHIADLTELNMNTLSNWSKNKEHFEELTQAKKPEDFLMTQMMIINMGQLEAMTYAKKAGDIWMNAIEQMNEVCTDVVRDTTAQTSEVIKSRQKSKE